MTTGITNFLFQVGWETWVIFKEASFFLLLGFLLAGVLAVAVPPRLVQRLLGRGRVSSVLWASAIGVPLPLCSCGVLPAAVRLSQQGATKGATVSFLISTPETDVDAIALTYALMGPVFAVCRAVAGVVTAVVAGLATNLFGEPRRPQAVEEGAPAEPLPSSSGEAAMPSEPVVLPFSDDGGPAAGLAGRLRQLLHYAFREVLDEISYWLVLGILVAALVTVFLPPSIIERYLSSGLLTMLVMLVISIPIYTCASASTPIAAALVMKGLDPGAALVFLLAGPATNMAAVIVLLKFLGRRVVAIYLGMIAVVSVLSGYALNWIFARWQIDPVATIGSGAGPVPEPVKIATAVILIGMLLVSLWRTHIPHEWLQVRDWIGALTGLHLTARGLKLATAGLAVALYLGSGIFTVGAGEVGLKARFGRVVGGPLDPGLHLRWPWPIGEHRVIERDRVRRIEVGFRSEGATRRSEEVGFGKQGLTLVGPGFPVPPAGAVSFWYQKEKIEDESFLLSGDENIIDVAFTVQYRIEDPIAYTYTIANPEAVVRSVTIGAVRAAMATMTVDSIYTTEREEIEARVLASTQNVLDGYGVGVKVVALSLLSVHAPDEVHAAFRDVASAQEDKILITDRATTFAQESVNLAEGEAAAMIESARAFREQKILEAEGDALAFQLRERGYRRAPELTRFRLHLEALEEVLPAPQKILRPGRADLKELDLWLLQPPGTKRGQ